MPPWILVLTTLAIGGNAGTSTPSIETTTVRIGNEITCRTMERDFTYDRTLNGVRITGRARCYRDAPDVEVPEGNER